MGLLFNRREGAILRMNQNSFLIISDHQLRQLFKSSCHGIPVILLFVQFVICSPLFAQCYYNDSLSDKQYVSRQIELALNHSSGINDTCLAGILGAFTNEKKEDIEKLRLLVKRSFARTDNKGHVLLFSGFRNRAIYKNSELWQEIKGGWMKKNRSPDEAFMEMLDEGFPAMADTVFTIFDNDDILDKYDMARWARVKSVTGDYYKIPDLLCRSLTSADRRFIEITLMQFSEILQETGPEITDTVVELFSRHCFSSLHMDDQEKSTVFSWVIGTWGELNKYRKQIEFIKSSVPVEQEQSVLLYQLSESNYTRKNYIAAAAAASAAYNVKGDEKGKRQAAKIAFQSWVALNRSDSVMVWLERAGIENDIGRTEAVALYQNKGQIDKSRQLLDALPQSLSKDTLRIRQCLCANEKEEVAFALFEKSPHLSQEPVLSEIWRLQLLLFYKKFATFQHEIDSLRMLQDWSYFPQLLRYRYWVQICGGQEDLLAIWAAVEYNNFTGKPQNSSVLFSGGSIAEPQRSLLALEVAKALSTQSAQEVVRFFDACKDTFSDPGVLYCKAEANLGAGNQNLTADLLQSIVMNYPFDVYSGKARILLKKVTTKGR
jgi:tetratricopeptide (TPR) repeat protein